MKNILVVEDEKPIADILNFTLSNAGFKVTCLDNGNEALKEVEKNPPDLMLLDLMLPEIDGLDICRAVRLKHQFPIIMLTARDSELDKVLGLEMGADDYVTKPFSNRELLARIRSVLRRTHTELNATSTPQDTITISDITIDINSYIVKKNNQIIDLTHREFDLLIYLAKNENKVLTRDHLLQTVWGYDYFGDARTVDVTIRRLREKIEDDPSNPQYIMTRRGIGYSLRKHDKKI